MTHLFDSDHISFLLRRSSPEYPAVARRVAGHRPDDLAFPVVGFQEQVLGANAYINRARTPAEVLRGYEILSELVAGYRAAPVAPFDAAALVEYDRLRALKVRIGTNDLRIAAIARSRNLIVVTRNTSDFGQVPGLVTEDWTK